MKDQQLEQRINNAERTIESVKVISALAGVLGIGTACFGFYSQHKMMGAYGVGFALPTLVIRYISNKYQPRVPKSR